MRFFPLSLLLAGCAVATRPAPTLEAPARAQLSGWHTSLEAALEAATVSRKQVLLFELFGRLDEEHC